MNLRWTLAAAALLVTGTASLSAQEKTDKSAAAAAPQAQSAQAQSQAQQKPPAPLTPADKSNLSYSVGFITGARLAGQMEGGSVDIDVNQIVRGLQDAMTKKQPGVPEQTMSDLLNRLEYQINAKMKVEFDKLAADNKAKGERFFAENKSKKGVISLPSGVQYVVIEEGSGSKRPTLQSEVTVHFRLSLLNGQELDSSFARGEPVKFKVSEVLKGWQEVLPLMKIGDYWRVYVPASLAYGERGDGRRIGPDESLVFELKLIDIKP